VTNTWSEICTSGSIPSSRTFHRAVVVGTSMYLLGGYDGTDRLQDLYSIDIGTIISDGSQGDVNQTPNTLHVASA
jgi:hypothetical protein